MKTQSAKAKGRRCAQELKEKILGYFPDLGDGDIIVTSSGASGEDLQFSPKARERFPFSVECKNVERIKIWKAIAQAESHAEDNETQPIVVFKRNHSRMWACVPIECLLYFLVPEDTSAPSDRINN